MPKADEHPHLSDAELAVLECIADGLTNEEIAEALVISPNTVHTHIAHIFAKLGIHDRHRAGRVYRTLMTLSRRDRRALATPDGASGMEVDRGKLHRLGVATISDARRLYRQIITHGG